MRNYARILHKNFKQHMFWIFVREAILTNILNICSVRKKRIKQGLSYIFFLSILYNSKFMLMATSLGTNAVVITRVHCRKSQTLSPSLKTIA